MAKRGFEISRLPGFATIAIAAFVLLYLPIVTLVAYSFNASTSVAVWGGFSLHWYVDAWANDDVKAATMRSLVIGASAAFLSTVLATMAALGTTRRKAFKGQTFRRVTLPLLAPGIMAGAMLAFVISLDDVVITEFVKSGGQDTLPTYMLGQLRRAFTPEVNAISTMLLGVTVVLLTLFFLLTRKKD